MGKSVGPPSPDDTDDDALLRSVRTSVGVARSTWTWCPSSSRAAAVVPGEVAHVVGRVQDSVSPSSVARKAEKGLGGRLLGGPLSIPSPLLRSQVMVSSSGDGPWNCGDTERGEGLGGGLDMTIMGCGDLRESSTRVRPASQTCGVRCHKVDERNSAPRLGLFPATWPVREKESVGSHY